MDGRESAAAESDDLKRRDALIHREFFQVAILIAIAVAGFFLTRAIAASTRSIAMADAEGWFERGQQQMAAGQVDAAIESLRRASVRNRSDRRYALALARALARNGDVEAARGALLTLRDASSENLEINVQLVELLLESGQNGRALSELMALTSGLPDDAAVHVRVARLFERAGDSRHAREQYERAQALATSAPQHGLEPR